MKDSQYQQQVDATIDALEWALDEVDDDLDYETAGGVLTVNFSNGSTMVFSRQVPTQQLWLATRSGGYHFEYDLSAQDWRDTRSGALFKQFVVEQIASQAGVAFKW